MRRQRAGTDRAALHLLPLLACAALSLCSCLPLIHIPNPDTVPTSLRILDPGLSLIHI